ncbi:hypothetical protein MalM25_29230 [Planctomycetes bacterium MalM25]|nr:hypothetical protein MalM25_29230 [Planctomycetes bacterium MalM25]
MKIHHLLSTAMLAVLSAVPVCAAPMIQFVDNLDSSVTLQVVTDANGSLGAELAVVVSSSPGLQLTGVTVDTGNFDTANPGDNPFIPGSPVGGDTNGLWTDLPNGAVFAAYGSGNLGIGAFDFLTLQYQGTGTLEAFGLVAQQGQLNDGLSASIDLVIPEPTTAVLALIGLVGIAGRRRFV